jgi:Cytochrome P460
MPGAGRSVRVRDVVSRPGYRGLAVVAAISSAVTLVGCGGSSADVASGPGATGPPLPTSPPAKSGPPELAAPPPVKSPPGNPAVPELPGIPLRDARAIAGYRSWQRLAKPPREVLRGLGRAHGADVRSIWVNRSRTDLTRRGKQRFPYPVGSIVVKQVGRSDAAVLVAIMRKVRGSSDLGWSWVEYQRDSASEDFARVSAPTRVCTGCHTSATADQKTDGVFWSLR